MKTVTDDLPPTETTISVSVPTIPVPSPSIQIPTVIPEETPAKTNSNEYSLAIEAVGDAPVERYGFLELELQTNLRVTNPYDNEEIDLRVTFKAPSGRELVAGAFWYQDFDLRSRLPQGEPGWRARFTPDESGDWVAVAYAPALGLRSEPYAFHVNPSSQPGFIRVNPSNPRYFAFDNGDLFFPIGLNICWWGGSLDPIKEYSKWMDLFTKNGGNTIRVWMAAWSFGIEWKDTGLGNYDNRQYEAWLLDRLFQLADEHGVKIILVLVNHGPFSLMVNTEWKDNPYNAALGGPLTSPEQFFSDPIAKSYFERRLNYIANRWGFSPDLLAWEWFNEVNLTPVSDEALIPWIKEMTAYLRERDVNHHLTTISFAMSTPSQIYQIPELDIAQKHEYASQNGSSEHDLAGRAAEDFTSFARSIPAKPILLGEFGYSAANDGEDVEKSGIHLHNGLWASTFSGYAGSGMYWWWDNYVEANNLWINFKGLADFLSGVDLTQYQSFSPLKITKADGSAGQADGIGLRGEDILVWLRSDGYTTQASIDARNKNPGSINYVPPMVEGLYLTLDDMNSGEYTVKWYDPQNARWLDEVIARTQDHRLTVAVPAFRYDLAAKISRNP